MARLRQYSSASLAPRRHLAWAVEVSQLYQAPWIQAVRATRGGALLLGQGFLWSDLVCHAVGVTLAAALDVMILRRRTSLEAP